MSHYPRQKILAPVSSQEYDARCQAGLVDAGRSMVELVHDPRSLRWGTWLDVGASTRCSGSRGSSNALWP